MTTTKETFTQKEFNWNKKILLICKVITAVAYLWIIFLCVLLIKVTSFSILGIVISSICFYKAIKFNQSLEKETMQIENRNNNTWGKGSEAETVVAKSLKELPSEFKVIEDFYTGHGNIDFIVIGPTGIFTIEVKATRGQLRYDQRLLINGKVPEKDYIHQTEAERLRLIHTLQKKFYKNFPVTGLLEFPYGNVDRASINGPIKEDIWIGEGNFHMYLIQNKREFLTLKEISNIYTFLMNEKNK